MSLDKVTTLPVEAEAIELSDHPDETHYRKIRKRLPDGTELKASFYRWPIPDTEFPPDFDCNTSRWFRLKNFRPPQKALCFAATYLSQYLADRGGPNSRKEAFAFTGAVALMALGVSNRPTYDVNVVIRSDIRSLLVDMAQNPRFVLPRRLVDLDWSVQIFVRVGPHMGDTVLAQDNLIYTTIFRTPYDTSGCWDHCVEPVMRVHETPLNVRSLSPLYLLRSKLYIYSSTYRRQDWLDAFDVCEKYIRHINSRYLDPYHAKIALEEPPEGLAAPEEWHRLFEMGKNPPNPITVEDIRDFPNRRNH